MASIHPSKLKQIKEWYSDGFSARQIAEKLLVGLDAVYYFMRHHGIMRRNARETNELRFLGKPLTYRLATTLNHTQEQLKLLAVSLYWAEGAKRGHTVDFANSDVSMCQIFVEFLRKVCRVEEKKLRGFIYCHENQDAEALIAFWSKALNIPKGQFTKPYIRRQGASQKKYPERMINGLVHIRYGDLKLLRQILTWIEEHKKTWVGM